MSRDASTTSNGDIRIVCFDWGGVLLRIVRTWPEACERAGLDVRGESGTTEWGARRRPVAHAYQQGRLTCEEFHARLSESMGGLYSPEEVRRIHDAWLIEEYPGVDGVVDRLLALPHIETALLSNTNHGHWARQAPVAGDTMPHFPTAARLKHRHASHLLRLAKPGVEIYWAFERLTGASGAQILFFDDLAENVETARSLGWRAEQIDHLGETAAQIETHLRTHGVF
jgi:FMN phosphatase YigB (HAD superfamily)